MATKKKAARKKPAKKTIKRAAPKKRRAPLKKKKPAAARKPKESIIGKITHYFPHVQAAVIKLKAPLSVEERIRIKGHTTDFTQAVTSMQIDRVAITKAKKGDEIGLLVNSRVRQHDTVYKV